MAARSGNPEADGPDEARAGRPWRGDAGGAFQPQRLGVPGWKRPPCARPLVA